MICLAIIFYMYLVKKKIIYFTLWIWVIFLILRKLCLRRVKMLHLYSSVFHLLYLQKYKQNLHQQQQQQMHHQQNKFIIVKFAYIIYFLFLQTVYLKKLRSYLYEVALNALSSWFHLKCILFVYDDMQCQEYSLQWLDC